MFLKKLLIILATILFFASCDNNGVVTPPNDLIHVDGLSTKISASNMTGFRSFSKDIVNGYDNLQEFSDDLDKLGYEAGMDFINNYAGGWYKCVDDIDIVMEATDAGTNSDNQGYETNNQVGGVDEMDSVKSDGKYVYTSVGKELLIFNLDGETTTKKVLDDKGHIAGLLLNGNKLVVLINKSGTDDEIILLTLSNGTISSLESYKAKSNVTEMRMKGDNVIVYGDYSLQFHDMYEKLFDNQDSYTWLDGVSEEDKEEAKKRLETEVPKWRNKLLVNFFGDGDNVDISYIKNILKMYEQKKDKLYKDFIEVFSFNIHSGFNNIERSGAFTNGWNNVIYSDGETSVIANNGWVDIGDHNWKEMTFLTTFYTNGTNTKPASVTSFVGRILNQFCIDINEDYVRLGITEGRWEESQNSLIVLEKDTLNEVGRLGNIGKPRERITSMRFMGDIAYVVTFERTDPFYVIDLSSPEIPTILGELEINGFSSYIHPIDSETLLTIGMNADNSGAVTGFQVSIYDVSNYSNPRRIFEETLEGSWSDANRDHHAFRYVPKLNKLIVPVSDSFTIFNIYKEEGITIQGEIPHPFPSNDYRWILNSNHRSLVIDGNIITLGNGKIQSSDVNDLTKNWEIKLQ